MTPTRLLPGTPLRIAAEEGAFEIPFSAVQAYHGHAALAMLALIYQGLRGALARLEIDGHAVPRGELSVVSGHPGPGVRDAFECVTRAVSRGCYHVDRTLPGARYGHAGDKSYSFVLQRDARQVHAVLRAGVLPERFFELLGDPDPQARREHALLRRGIAAEVLEREPEGLFEFSLRERAAG